MTTLRSLFCLSVAAIMLHGCGPYHLQGRVVQGPTLAVLLVNKDDKRLEQPGIDSAKIELTLDPSSMRPKRLADAITDYNGDFDVLIEEFGAGALEYEIGLLVQRLGYQSLYQTIGLPGRDRRLIIVMPTGRDQLRRRENVLDETMRLKEQLE